MADPKPWPGDLSGQVPDGTRFLLQIVSVDPPHVVARLPAGDALERALIEHLASHIIARGVGVFKTEAHVRADILAGIETAIMELKAQTARLRRR